MIENSIERSRYFPHWAIKKPITTKSRWVQLGVILLQPSGGKQLFMPDGETE
jgi:hypothetical protein